jgi:hypothetical protein
MCMQALMQSTNVELQATQQQLHTMRQQNMMWCPASHAHLHWSVGPCWDQHDHEAQVPAARRHASEPDAVQQSALADTQAAAHAGLHATPASQPRQTIQLVTTALEQRQRPAKSAPSCSGRLDAAHADTFAHHAATRVRQLLQRLEGDSSANRTGVQVSSSPRPRAGKVAGSGAAANGKGHTRLSWKDEAPHTAPGELPRILQRAGGNSNLKQHRQASAYRTDGTALRIAG